MTCEPVEGTTTVGNVSAYANNNPLNRADPAGMRANDSAFVGPPFGGPVRRTLDSAYADLLSHQLPSHRGPHRRGSQRCTEERFVNAWAAVYRAAVEPAR
jgi:hypothetical protein